ncbi:MAG: antitoxin VapB family protein [Candidatus Thermoplasmatota archaeon]
MSKNISISDDVYEWLKEIKGDESFSSAIRKLKNRDNLEEINGMKVLKNWKKTKEEIEKMSEKEWDRLEDAT